MMNEAGAKLQIRAVSGGEHPRRRARSGSNQRRDAFEARLTERNLRGETVIAVCLRENVHQLVKGRDVKIQDRANMFERFHDRTGRAKQLELNMVYVRPVLQEGKHP